MAFSKINGLDFSSLYLVNGIAGSAIAKVNGIEKSGGSIALVRSVRIPGSANGGSSSGADFTGCTLIAVWVAGYSLGPFPTLSDSQSNSWTGLTGLGGDPKGQWYYVLNPSVGVSQTFTLTGGSSYSSACVLGYSGVTAYESQAGTTVSGTSPSPGTLTPAGDNRLLLYGVAAQGDSNDIASVNVGSLILHQAGVSGETYIMGVGAEIQTTSTARTPTFAFTGSGQVWASAGAIFS